MNGAELLLGKEALARHGSRIALICGEESLTFAELAARVARAAGALAALGVRPGDRVLFLMRDTPDFAVAWLGAVRAGAVAVALNDKLSDAELEHAAVDSRPSLSIFDREFSHRSFARMKPMLASLFADHAASAPAAAAFDAAAETPAFMLYSSGTTGRPKGIVHAHRGFTSLGLASESPPPNSQ